MTADSSPPPGRQRLPEVCSFAALLLVITSGVWGDVKALTQFPVAAGVDGYYYALQVKELLSGGHLYFHTGAPLVLYAFAGLSYLVGDTILAIKVGSALLHGALCLTVFSLLVSVGCSRWLGVLGAALTAHAGLHLHMVVEFVNNLGAVTLLIGGVCCALKALRGGRAFWATSAGLCLLAAALSHKSTLPLSLGLAALAGLSRLLLPAETPRAYRAGALSVLCLLLVAPALAAAQPLWELPPWLKSEFLTGPSLPFRRAAFAEKLILLLAAPAALALLFRSPRRERASLAGYLICVTALWSLLVTLNPFLNFRLGWSGIAVRLSGVAYIQVGILLPGLLWLTHRARPAAVWYVLAAAAPLFVLSLRAEPPSGLQPAYLYNRAQVIESLPRHRQQLGPSPLVVAEHGDEFVVTYASGVPSQQRPPSDTRYENIYWLISGIKPSMVEPPMITLARGAGGSSIILSEREGLRALVDKLPEREKERLFFLNRHLFRACLAAGLADPSGRCFQVP